MEGWSVVVNTRLRFRGDGGGGGGLKALVST